MLTYFGLGFPNRFGGSVRQDQQWGTSDNDIFLGSPRGDAMQGWNGVDLVDYRTAWTGVTVSLITGAGGGGADGDRYSEIEGILGSFHDDWFEGHRAADAAEAPVSNYFLGRGGDDTAHGYGGDDWLDGGEGRDSLFGGDGDDRLFGGAGDDLFDGGDGADLIEGGSGNDDIEGGAGDDAIAGGHGDDFIRGGDGDDTLDGGAGNDRLEGGAGDDRIRDDRGDNLIHGGAGDDEIWGGAHRDIVHGGEGSDTISVGAGFDWVDGGAGDDVVWLGDGGDFFAARDTYGAGNDKVYGESGNDFIHTGRGSDLIDGGTGNDVLDGGSGGDVLTGGAGADRFHFYLGSGRDPITDFSFGDGDRIHLSGAIGETSSWVDGDDAYIDLGNDNVITLLGVGAGELASIVDSGILLL